MPTHRLGVLFFVAFLSLSPLHAQLCLGDVNEDGNRNVIDAVNMLLHIVGTNPLTGTALAAADVNGDGAANVVDAVKLLLDIVGTEPLAECPVGCVGDLEARPKFQQVTLTWTHSGADSYNVYQSTTPGGPYNFVANTTSTFSTYTQSGLVNGTTYYYVVFEVIAGQEICQSNEDSATPLDNLP